nr:sulfite reductase flavoprotein subunit alpha [Solimonas marina]
MHWLLGISAGLVLAVMGLTGGLMSFEDEIMAALSHDRARVEAPGAPALSPDALRARLEAQAPGQQVDRLVLHSDPAAAAQARLSAPGARGERQLVYVNPYSGEVLGPERGSAFFSFVRRVHRWLALPDGPNGYGRQITGIAALSLIFFVLSGLYLRWPRQPLNWRAWLALDLRRTGHNLYRSLHIVIGTWVALVYLVFALTGLWWSYEWYRAGVTRMLTGEAPARREAHGPRGERAPAAVVPLDSAWRTFVASVGPDYGQATLFTAPQQGRLRIERLPRGARYSRMTDRYEIEARNGTLVSLDRYADRPLGAVIVGNILPIHRGQFFGLPGQIVMGLAALTMPMFTITGLLLYLRRRRRRATVSMTPLSTPVQPADAATADWLIAYASQTGGAERYARQAAQACAAAGASVAVLPLAKLDAELLGQARQALFVVSTYGDGEPPDLARRFARTTMRLSPALTQLHFGVLALGDREYPQFCAFGRAVERWLLAAGARPLFATIEADGDEATALAAWREALLACGAADIGVTVAPAFTRWRLIERRCLNAGGIGLPTYRLAFEAIDGAPHWQAGDIAEVAPRPATTWPAMAPAALAVEAQDGGAAAVLDVPLSGADVASRLPVREYSIASIAADGRLELLVRQVRRDDGSLGLGSGWLTAGLPEGGELALRLRANPGFRHTPGEAPLVLIGNGTGMAGLRAHLQAHAAAGRGGHWLLFGERNAAFDAYFDDELQAWRADGTLARLDRAYSRDAGCGRYVQDLLRDAADELRRWADRGAVFLVCGSLEGMAAAVDRELRAALGDTRVDTLIEQGAYRRDVY